MLDESQKDRTSGTLVRGRGRPRQNESQVGRDKLIERTRAVMNLRPRTDIQRREIAEAIGVTPALITYYFPDKWSLVEAAAHPIIVDHVAAIDALLSSSDSTREKFRSLVSTYIHFNKEYGHLLDYYISSANNLNKPENIRILAGAHQRIVGFFRDGIREGMFKNVDAEMLQSMLWCICRYLATIPDDRDSFASRDADRDRLAQEHQTLVFDLFLGGVFRPMPPEPGPGDGDRSGR